MFALLSDRVLWHGGLDFSCKAYQADRRSASRRRLAKGLVKSLGHLM